MKDKIEQILSDAKEKIANAAAESELQKVRSDIVGKQGALALLLKELPTIEVSLRPEMGKILNQAKSKVTELIEEKRMELKLKASEVSPDFDCSVPGIMPGGGGLHPITQMCYDLNDAFRSMGFEVFQEDDITSEMYAFDKLNFPQNHPARESMDTYWLEGHDSGSTNEKLCLRPHLTGGSVCYMQTHKPPYRFVYPGRVYRNETTDAHHERAFFQYEALIVDKDLQAIQEFQPTDNLLFGIVSNGTSIQENGISLIHILRQFIACHTHHAGYNFTIGYIHLAAVCLYQ